MRNVLQGYASIGSRHLLDQEKLLQVVDEDVFVLPDQMAHELPPGQLGALRIGRKEYILFVLKVFLFA